VRPSSNSFTALLLLTLLAVFAPRSASAQSTTASSVSSVLLTSGLGQNGTLLNVFSETQVQAPLAPGTPAFGSAVKDAGNFTVVQGSLGAVSSALTANIATALSVVPLASPASAVLFKTDPVTGVELPADRTLGPVFVERAETIGKNKFYIGITNQSFHFTSLNGQSLNSLTGLYGGGGSSALTPSGASQPAVAVPASFQISTDVRLSQDTAFITYGATNRFDISVGLPIVHSSVAATTYNAEIYGGNGLASPGDCWCVNTFTPGKAPSSTNPNSLFEPVVGQSSLGKTGFGDLLLRFKGTVVDEPHFVLALGTDLRLPTGDAQNFLGTGATSIKPFTALSLYTKQWHEIVFAPHFNLGWQYSGKSSLAGQVQGASSTSSPAPPFTTSKDFLPDVLSWAVGSEVAFGRRNTLVVDILGDQIGLIHGIQTLTTQTVSISGRYSPVTYQQLTGNISGLVAAPNRVSFGQYYGAFGWKTRIAGNLIATVNFLTRFDNNGLTAKIVPLYGLGYSF
jgi:hypothetical protein